MTAIITEVLALFTGLGMSAYMGLGLIFGGLGFLWLKLVKIGR